MTSCSFVNGTEGRGDRLEKTTWNVTRNCHLKLKFTSQHPVQFQTASTGTEI